MCMMILMLSRSLERLEGEVEALEKRATEAESAEAELLQELKQSENVAADRCCPSLHVGMQIIWGMSQVALIHDIRVGSSQEVLATSGSRQSRLSGATPQCTTSLYSPAYFLCSFHQRTLTLEEVTLQAAAF